jgi:hypothetical protein
MTHMIVFTVSVISAILIMFVWPWFLICLGMIAMLYVIMFHTQNTQFSVKLCAALSDQLVAIQLMKYDGQITYTLVRCAPNGQLMRAYPDGWLQQHPEVTLFPNGYVNGPYNVWFWSYMDAELNMQQRLTYPESVDWNLLINMDLAQKSLHRHMLIRHIMLEP